MGFTTCSYTQYFSMNKGKCSVRWQYGFSYINTSYLRSCGVLSILESILVRWHIFASMNSDVTGLCIGLPHVLVGRLISWRPGRPWIKIQNAPSVKTVWKCCLRHIPHCTSASICWLPHVYQRKSILPVAAVTQLDRNTCQRHCVCLICVNALRPN